MKSTRNTLFTWLKGTAWMGAMAVGTAVLIAFSAGHPPQAGMSELRVQRATESLPVALMGPVAQPAGLR